MRKRFLISAIVASVLASQAYADADEDCLLYDSAAKGAMENRQKGVPLADAMKIIKQSVGSSDEAESVQAYNALKLAFVEAYKTPKYGTERMQKEAVDEFRSKFYSECLSVRTSNQ